MAKGALVFSDSLAPAPSDAGFTKSVSGTIVSTGTRTAGAETVATTAEKAIMIAGDLLFSQDFIRGLYHFAMSSALYQNQEFQCISQ